MKYDIKPDNMKLWNQVCVTDPGITKHVGQRGGFTAIDAQAQVKRATELWGPYGTDWGVRDCQYEMFENEISLTAVFYYPGDEDSSFEIGSDMLWKPGNDSRKKLLTDLTTKALSKLGFNSDVFEGKFDDNKYVMEMKKKFNGDSKPEPKITDDQLDTIDNLVEETGTNGKKFMEYVTKTFNKILLTDLSYIAGESLIANLNAKLDKQNADN